MRNKLIWLIAVALLVAGMVWLIMSPSKPGKLDGFASCLAEKRAVFYGAFWCPHCQNQKALFGNSARLLPYVECSTPDGKNQLPICIEAKITGYPTWEFADGSRESGEISLERLAEKTSCVLPPQQ